MKLKLSLSAALMAGVISATAATQNAAPLAATTNANPQTAMNALFGDPAIAKGRGFEIKRSDLDQVVTSARATAVANGQMLPPDFEGTILEKLIIIQVLLQKATPADQAAGKEKADSQYTNLVKNISPEVFDRQLKALGMTMEQLRSKAAQEAVAEAALKRELNVKITDADAQDYYTKHSAEFELPEMAHCRHILLITIDSTTQAPLSTNAVAAKRKQAEDLLKKIRGGADFVDLAKQYSEDPGSKGTGGELPAFDHDGAFPGGRMIPEFTSAAFALTNSQVSDIITSQFGFHIIKMIEKTPAKKYGFSEPIPQASGETAATLCKNALETLKIRQLAPDYVNKLRVEEQVEILDASLKAADERVQAAAAAAAAMPAGESAK